MAIKNMRKEKYLESIRQTSSYQSARTFVSVIYRLALIGGLFIGLSPIAMAIVTMIETSTKTGSFAGSIGGLVLAAILSTIFVGIWYYLCKVCYQFGIMFIDAVDAIVESCSK